MNSVPKILLLFLIILIAVPEVQAQSKNEKEKTKQKKGKRKKKYKLPDIDLSHWKVTIPAGNPAEVGPPDILDYATNESLKKYMYNDSTRGALVFYALPDATTKNTKYSRSELREQMEPGNNNVNWTFEQGGTMKGRLAMDAVSRNSEGKYHKVIIMQIHGRLTNEQKELIGEDDNNAPPMLKIYWQNGKVRVKTKILKDPKVSNIDILKEDAWGDDDGFNFEQEVGFKPFDLEVRVSKGKMTIVLNGSEFKTYKGLSIERWGIFENYFKAGNYFQSRDEGSYARVLYFKLDVKH